MQTGVIDIIAHITLFGTEKGGRKGPTPTDKLGCWFVIDNHVFDCRLMLSEIGSLKPGQEATVPISFLNPSIAKKFIKKGTKFKLKEVSVIGEGVVLDVFM